MARIVREIMELIKESIISRDIYLKKNIRYRSIYDWYGLVKIIKYEKDVNSCDYQGNTALHYACKYESVEAVKLLLEQPHIRLNVQNRDMETPLHVAAYYNKTLTIMKLLIEAGSDLYMKDYDDQTPLHYIILNMNDFSVKVKMCRLVLENGFDITKIDNVYLLELILECRISISKYDENSERYKNYLNFNSMFLYYNIDVNCRGPLDNIPSQMVFSNGIHAVIDLFIDYIDFFDCVSMENSNLMLAIECEYPRVLEIVNKGADINFMNEMGRSCLHKSLECKNNQLFKYFWQHCNLDEILKVNEDFFDDVLTSTIKYSADNFLETIYIILESKYALQLLENSSKNSMYQKLVEMFSIIGCSQEDRLKILFTILSIYNEISLDDFHSIYKAYGFKEEFNVFLLVNARVFNDSQFHDDDYYINIFKRYLSSFNPVPPLFL